MSIIILPSYSLRHLKSKKIGAEVYVSAIKEI